MAARIRLARFGAKKRPFYRIVVADSRMPREGRFKEIVGLYDPKTDPPKVVLKEERVHEWLSKGAAPSDTVVSIFKRAGIVV